MIFSVDVVIRLSRLCVRASLTLMKTIVDFQQQRCWKVNDDDEDDPVKDDADFQCIFISVTEIPTDRPQPSSY